MTSGAICGFGQTLVRRRIARCPTERTRRRMTQTFSGPYYPDIFTCCGCGDSWSGDERLPRPFAPRWRKQATARARSDWTDALSAHDFRTLTRRVLDYELSAEEFDVLARRFEYRKGSHD